MILRNQRPLLHLVRRRLARHDHMTAMLLGRLPRARILLPVRMVRILPVHRHAGRGRVVQRRRLLRRVVAEPHRHEHRPVRDRDVQAVRGRLRAELALLQLHDRLHRFHQRGLHLRDGVLRFPRGRALAAGEEGHVERGEVLGVGGALDGAVGGVVHELAHVAGDFDVVLEEAVVHEDVAAEGERVVVHGDDGGGGGGPDVGEKGFRGHVGADVQEILVVLGRLRGAVQEGALPLAGAEFFSGGRVPGYAEAVGVEHAVPSRNLMLGRDVVWIMGE